VTPERGAGGSGGILYVVATPIGNLGDITLRALEILRSVPVVAAEDTRITRRLLARYDIETRLVSYHARSAAARAEELLAHLRGGADLALTTDAGTPGISDPGEELVESWSSEGGRVVPIPGASAVLAAVAATGIAGPRWVFEGFLPRSGRERRERLARIASDERGSVIYEAPTRLGSTLRDLAAACGGDRPAAVARELTKIHEQLLRGTLAGLADAVDSGAIPQRGEVVIVVGARGPATSVKPSEADRGAELARAIAAVDALVRAGTTRSAAARTVARERGLPSRELYRGKATTSEP
jgi:16S rRNA (cytidine1402-2'-O)-methyltransferase